MVWCLGRTGSRYNYQMGNTLTWPPHDTDYIPTGAYSAGYKGPYDNDYDWPDDTQVRSSPSCSRVRPKIFRAPAWLYAQRLMQQCVCVLCVCVCV